MQSPTPSLLVGFQLEGQADQVAQDPTGYLSFEDHQQWRFQSLGTLFQCLTTFILRKKILSCYLLPYTLPNKIWLLLLYDPIKFLQTKIRSLQISGANNPCWSPSNKSISTYPVIEGPCPCLTSFPPRIP